MWSLHSLIVASGEQDVPANPRGALANKNMQQDLLLGLLQMRCSPDLQHCTQSVAMLSCHTSNVAAPVKRLPSVAVLQVELQPSKPQCCPV